MVWNFIYHTLISTLALSDPAPTWSSMLPRADSVDLGMISEIRTDRGQSRFLVIKLKHLRAYLNRSDLIVNLCL